MKQTFEITELEHYCVSTLRISYFLDAFGGCSKNVIFERLAKAFTY